MSIAPGARIMTNRGPGIKDRDTSPKTSVLRSVAARNFGWLGLGELELLRPVGRLRAVAQVVILA